MEADKRQEGHVTGCVEASSRMRGSHAFFDCDIQYHDEDYQDDDDYDDELEQKKSSN